MISARAAKTVAGSAFSAPGIKPFASAVDSSATLCPVPAVSVFDTRAIAVDYRPHERRTPCPIAR
jgi:hypothetical protein